MPEQVMHGYKGHTSNRGFSLYKRDDELVDWCAEFLGCKRSEVVRTAVRNLAAQLASMNLKGAKNLPKPE